jgi:cardiolipin synthase A/B
MKFSRRARIVAASVLATALVVVVGANLMLGDKVLDRDVPTLYTVEDPQFRRSINVLLGPQILEGNRVQTLVNGERFFPAMLEAIRGAKRTITFETYIYWGGKVGEQFTEALVERAKAGVKVHLLFDAFGSGKIDKAAVERMEQAGVKVERYNPVRIQMLARLNNRTHRKILVVDGRVGFTGGAGIADEWAGDARTKDEWRDTQFRIEGPAVAQMQAAFMENWIEVTGEVLHGGDYFPPLAPAGKELAQFFISSPGGGGESMQLLYLMSIAAAARSIHLSAAYFVPDDSEVRMLVAAAKRGVRVQLVVPGHETDSPIVRRASRSTWGKLLQAGVEIYEYQPTFFHCKVMVVDGLWTSLGSTNFDNRSFSVNDEANLNVFDAAFAAEQVKVFEADRARARRISLEEWQNRPWTERLWEHTVGLLSSQL